MDVISQVANWGLQAYGVSLNDMFDVIAGGGVHYAGLVRNFLGYTLLAGLLTPILLPYPILDGDTDVPQCSE